MNNKTLIAMWKPGQDPAVDGPADVCWGNGSPATLEDYAQHRAATNASAHSKDGAFTVAMYPDVMAEVRYDHSISRCVCQASDRRIILELSDPDVADDQIIAELSTHPVFYRPVIRRETME
jgi:hypothetical protein